MPKRTLGSGRLGRAGGGRVLLVAGGRDTAVTPGEVACIDDKLRAEGVETQVCVDSAAEHMDVVERNVPFALSWVDALLAGRPLPSCDASGLPACR